mmetsp:Transcript_4203/g.26642  ORF Transcript_4203/g.26642 Transcript_4203/m.26642 type:complete len:226 (+) Transcript_4203:993-1670(+)
MANHVVFCPAGATSSIKGAASDTNEASPTPTKALATAMLRNPVDKPQDRVARNQMLRPMEMSHIWLCVWERLANIGEASRSPTMKIVGKRPSWKLSSWKSPCIPPPGFPSDPRDPFTPLLAMTPLSKYVTSCIPQKTTSNDVGPSQGCTRMGSTGAISSPRSGSVVSSSIESTSWTPSIASFLPALRAARCVTNCATRTCYCPSPSSHAGLVPRMAHPCLSITLD